MRNNVTAICNNVMLGKIRLAIALAVAGKGEYMNGHAHRTYVTNRNGRNVLRVSYYPAEKQLFVWGDNGRNVTGMVKAAFERARAQGLEIVNATYTTKGGY